MVTISLGTPLFLLWCWDTFSMGNYPKIAALNSLFKGFVNWQKKFFRSLESLMIGKHPGNQRFHHQDMEASCRDTGIEAWETTARWGSNTPVTAICTWTTGCRLIMANGLRWLGWNGWKWCGWVSACGCQTMSLKQPWLGMVAVYSTYVYIILYLFK